MDGKTTIALDEIVKATMKVRQGEINEVGDELTKQMSKNEITKEKE